MSALLLLLLSAGPDVNGCLDGLASAGNEGPARRISLWVKSCESIVPICSGAFAAASGEGSELERARLYVSECKKAACPGWEERAPGVCGAEVASEGTSLLRQWSSLSARLVRRDLGSSGTALAQRLEALAVDFRSFGDGPRPQITFGGESQRKGANGIPSFLSMVKMIRTRLVLGTPGVSSGFDPAEVERVVRQRQNPFLYCFESQLLAHPRLAGRLVVVFQIGAGGRVLATAIEHSTVPGDEIHPCLERQFAKLTFADPGSYAPVRVRYPIGFENEPATPKK